MRKRLLPLSLIAAMLVSVVGVGAHEHEGTCPLTKLPDCCKKAKSGTNATVSKARLCCNLNCSEPGSGGSSASSSFSLQQSVAPTGLLLPNSIPSSEVVLSSRQQPARPNYSSPKYIQHLALLI